MKSNPLIDNETQSQLDLMLPARGGGTPPGGPQRPSKRDITVITLRDFSNDEKQNEKELISKSKKGDGKAFSELFEAYKSKVYAKVYSILRNHQDTEDIVQETFSKCYKSLANYNQDCSFSTWIHTIAHNTALNLIRKNKNVYKISINDEDNHLDQDQTYLIKTSYKSCDKDVMRKEMSISIEKAIEKLPVNHQIVVRLFDIEGKSHREISKLIGVNECTVRSRLFYAHRTLQGILAEYKEML
jgi:RNA polymerase sigma factor (sigma-70 family)